jgi:16S rRNA (guanine527-N7)-methyltransferase
MKNRINPPVPADFSEPLAHAVATLGLALTSVQQQRLLDYLALLGKWNAAYNLTAVRDPREQLVVHLFDCLAILPAMRRWLHPGAVVADIGSGGGLPGVVIAISHPEVEVHTVDAVGKKAAFVTQVRAALGLTNLHAHHARAETLASGRDLPSADLIVSRAFASLADFIGLTAHLRAPTGRWLAMKGVLPVEELAALPPGVKLEESIALQVPELEAQRHLLVLNTQPA